MCVCVCVCVVSVIVKLHVLPLCVVDGRSRNPLYYYLLLCQDMDMIDSRTRTLSVPDQDTNMIDVGTRTWSRPGHGHDGGRDTDMMEAGTRT